MTEPVLFTMVTVPPVAISSLASLRASAAWAKTADNATVSPSAVNRNARTLRDVVVMSLLVILCMLPRRCFLVRLLQRACSRHLVQHFVLLIRVRQVFVRGRVFRVLVHGVLRIKDVVIHLAQAVVIRTTYTRLLL